MNKKTIFVKTTKGERDSANLSTDLTRILSLIDGKSRSEELAKRAPPSLRESWNELINELAAGGYIVDRDRPSVEPKIALPKLNPLKMFGSKPAAIEPKKPVAPQPLEDLDFHTKYAASAPTAEELARQKAEEAARARAEVEAAVAAAKQRSDAEARAKAEAKAKQESDAASRARAEAGLKAQQEAANREQAEARMRQEAAARMQAQQADARVRAEIEAAARAQQEAEARAKREAEATRLKAEQEAARLKAAQEAARIQAELDAAERAKAAAEAARRKAEEEAARVRAELEAARARAEAEAKALAEARARQAAEEKARQEAEARLRAEQEAAALARLKAEAEAAARLKAEQEAARRREQEAAAKARAEQEAAAKARAEAEARRSAASAPPEPAAQSYEINLDRFAGGAEEFAQPAAPAFDRATQARAEAEARAQQEEEQRAASRMNAAEMERLKVEAEAKADAARLKAEEEARRRAEEQALAEEQSKAWAEAEQRAKAQAKIEAEQAAQAAALSQAKAQKPVVARARRKPLPLGKIAAGLVVLALAVALALPYVYPLTEYIGLVEQRLSAQLKQPVHIGAMSAASLPPKLQLRNVTVGKAQEVKVGSMVLNFDLLSLFSGVKAISNAELEDVTIDGRVLDKEAASLKLLGGDPEYPMRHLKLERVKIVTDEIAVPSLNGIADIDAQGVISRLSLHSDNDKLGIDLQSSQGRWQLGVNLKESSLPFLPEVVFSDLSAKGELTDGEVNFTEVDGHIYKGILLGTAKLSWRKGWQLQGSLEAKTFEVDKMFPKFGVDGEMYGDATFSMSGVKLSQIGDAPRLDGSFTVKKGTFNVDMIETARLMSRDHLVGGRTHFDEMIGLVQLESHMRHFRQVKIVSNALSANGSFDVSPSNQLSGNFSAEIKMRSGTAPLTLFGTLTEPKLRAGR